MSDIDIKRGQVRAQCAAVAELARIIADVTEQCAVYLPDEILDIVGRRTARQMEWLGNACNEMDIVEDEGERLAPVFKAAHKMFPPARGEE